MAVPYEKVVAEDLNTGTGTVSVTMPNGGSDTGNKINLATFALTGSASWTPGSIAHDTQVTTTVTVTGAVVGDLALARFSLVLSGLLIHAWVSAADTVTVAITNNTGSTVGLAAGTVRALVFQVP